MKSERILSAMGGIDDGLIEAAESRAQAKKRSGWKWAAVAACLTAVVAGGIALGSGLSAPDTADLPLLTVYEDMGGYGFEGYMAYDISELVSGNPWSGEDCPDTLPVFRNPVTYNGAGAPEVPLSGEVLEAMRSRLLEAAERLGLENIQVTDNAPSEEEAAVIRERSGPAVPEEYFFATALIAQADGVKLSVGADLTVCIIFNPAIDLPEGYNFGYYAPYEDMQKVGEYLLEQYRDLLDMKNPQVNVTGGDYTFSGEQGYDVAFFDAAGDKVQRILNYNLNSASFSCDGEGRLWIIRLNQPDLSQKMGDYPIISVKEAQELLCSGHYITSVPEEMPGEEHIAKVELVYRCGCWDTYFMPYYHFYVELPDMVQDNGLKTFGAYYVPAVEGEYLSGMPVWDGRFNN